MPPRAFYSGVSTQNNQLGRRHDRSARVQPADELDELVARAPPRSFRVGLFMEACKASDVKRRLREKHGLPAQLRRAPPPPTAAPLRS